jgi:integrase/RNA polymerase subunit RPABC4/transcription elongation factor Spt4
MPSGYLKTEGEICMLGSITSEEKCPVCSSSMVDNGFTAVVCPKHPDQIARKLRVRFCLKGHSTQKKFSKESGLQSYIEARRFLDGIRYKTDEGTFDYRDYRADNPLGFANLAHQWLEMKEQKLARASYRPLRLYVNYAISVWGNRSVKTIGFAEIEDFLTKSLGHLSSKSQSNAKSALHDFFGWLRKRRLITHDQVPEFPVIEVSMKMRNLVDKETQGAILDKLREMSWNVNPRIWIAVKWLSTYFSIRPGEMLSLKEENIDTKIGVILVQPAGDKNREGKVIELLPEDVELVRSLPRGFPYMPFFRHLAAHSGAKPGDRFHHDLLMRWWARACKEVGVEGVSLYPGTKHSSVTALGKEFTPEQIRTASQISTN